MGEEEPIFLGDLFFNASYEIRPVCINGIQLNIHALHDSASSDFDLTGQLVWPASLALAEYICENSSLCHVKKILELGSGAGVTGLVASKLSLHSTSVILTDNNTHVLDLLTMNVNENFEKENRPVCSNLSWGKENTESFIQKHGTDFDLILGSDVVFWPTSVPLLVETVSALLKKEENAVFLLSYVERSCQTTESLFLCASQAGLDWKEIFLQDKQKYKNVKLYKFRHQSS